MHEDTVTLRTGFEISHGRLDEVRDFMKEITAFTCPMSIAFLHTAINREDPPTGAYGTELRRYGDKVLDRDGLMHEDMANVVIAAAQCSSIEEAKAHLKAAKGCPVLYLDHVALDS